MKLIVPPLTAIPAAAGSAGLYVAMSVAVGGEPWDWLGYGPLIAIVAGSASFARPRAFIWVAAAVVLGQFVGWTAHAALFEPQSLPYWPMVAFLTVPLFVAPVTAGAAVVGALLGHWHARRRRQGHRRSATGRT